MLDEEFIRKEDMNTEFSNADARFNKLEIKVRFISDFVNDLKI